MSVATEKKIAVMSIEDCQRLERPLRDDLEILDYEIRSIVARLGAEVRDAGKDAGVFAEASTTVLLSIAAGVMARAAEEHRAAFDASSFVATANNAATWASSRRLRYFLGGEA